MHTQIKSSREDLTVLFDHLRVKEFVMQIVGKDVVKRKMCRRKDRGEKKKGEKRLKREVHTQTSNPLAFAKMTNAGIEA